MENTTRNNSKRMSKNDEVIKVLKNITRAISKDDPAKRKQVIKNRIIAILGTGGLMALEYYIDKRTN